VTGVQTCALPIWAVRKTGLHSTRTNARYDAVLHLDFGKDGRAILRPRFD